MNLNTLLKTEKIGFAFLSICAVAGTCFAAPDRDGVGVASPAINNISGVEFSWRASKSPVVNGFVRILSGHQVSVLPTDVSMYSRYAIVDDAKLLKQWDIDSGKLLRTVVKNPQGFSACCAAASQDGKQVLIGIREFEKFVVQLWDMETGKLRRSFKGHKDVVNTVAFSPDEKYVFSVSNEGVIRQWNIATGKLISSVKISPEYRSVILSPNRKWAITERDSLGFPLRDVLTGEVIRKFDWEEDPHRIGGTPLVFSPDGKYFLGFREGDFGNILLLWEVETGKILRTFSVESEEGDATFTPDGKYVLFGSSIWDISTGKKMRTFRSDDSGPVAITPDGKYAIGGGGRIWTAAPSYAYALMNEVWKTSPPPNPPGNLEQGKYESATAYGARIKRAQEDYEEALKSYKPTDPSVEQLERSFSYFYGAPSVVSTSYDPDTNKFRFTVSAGGSPREYAFELKQQIANDKAENFDLALKSAKPVVRFVYLNGVVSVSAADVKIGERIYSAIPTLETIQSTREVLALGGK